LEHIDVPQRGGPSGVFHTTHWTEVFEARSRDEPTRRAALGHLLGSYWKPVYCYLRGKGWGHQDAKDLTQGFFHEAVLGRGLVQKADRTRGRFRTFLLKALERYAANVHRARIAKQRMPEGGFVSLEGIEESTVPEMPKFTSPSELFDYAWASALLDQVLAELREECGETGKSVHWRVFRARVLAPIMEERDPPTLDALCRKHRIPDAVKASNMIVTVKRRFQAILRRHVRQLVDSDSEAYDEIRHFIGIFASGRAG
jgi:DNA-directed RNA polymerase specialized sigma24 family protein